MTLTEEQNKLVNDISVRFRENKPSISEKSIKTYSSLIRSLYAKAHSKTTPFDFEWFDNGTAVLEIIKEKTPATQRTALSALIGFTKNNLRYKKYLEQLMTENNKKPTEVKSVTQEDNWLTFDEVSDIFEKLYETYKPLLKTKPPLQLNPQQWNHVLELMIMTLTCGYFIEPRRNLDWCEMKINKIDKEVDNWIDFDKKQFHFNRYKTDWKYEEQIIDIPKKLTKILKRFIRLSGDNEYLLTKNNDSKFESPDVTYTLNKVFKKNISTSMLRHIYLTQKYENAPLYSDMKKTAYNMAHSVTQGLEYVKV